jgi:hypothetical protein
VWDLPVRIVHWLLVIGIAGSYATHKLGVAYFSYHLWFGYLVVVLAAFRILWGFVGTRHARFASFLRGPRATGAYLVALLRGAAPATPGHNPLGGWMVIFLLLFLLAQGITGLFANDEIFNTGPLYGYISDASKPEAHLLASPAVRLDPHRGGVARAGGDRPPRVRRARPHRAHVHRKKAGAPARRTRGHRLIAPLAGGGTAGGLAVTVTWLVLRRLRRRYSASNSAVTGLIPPL